MDYLINHPELIKELIKLIGTDKVYSYIFNDRYIDIYHPFNYKNPDELNNYYSRMEYYSKVNKIINLPRFKSDNNIILHKNFILAEMEFLVRELSDKTFTSPVQYSYLTKNHPWDYLIDNILNN